MGDRAWPALVAVLLFAGALLPASMTLGADDRPSWFDDWGVEPGFSITEDSAGFVLPTSITFIPEPGLSPDDPLYFVTELRGTIKVVTRAREVLDFATVPAFEPEDEFPDGAGEGGLVAVCLDPRTGGIFTTFSYHDEDGLLRNGLTRFDTTPGVFSTAPDAVHDYSGQLVDGLSALSHQVGGCRVSGDSLFVSVGDGGDPRGASNPAVPVGKVLRLTTGGQPHPDNPFFDEGGPASLAWAVGLRNPFGIELVDGEVYVADNGVDVDRLLRLEGGEDYLWNGSDDSIMARANTVFQPAIGPAHMAYVGEGGPDWPADYRDSFYVTATTEMRGGMVRSGIVRLPYDISGDHALDQPSFFVRSLTDRRTDPAAIAVGPDGLYFAPLIPDESGANPILRVSYDPNDEHPHRATVATGGAEQLIETYECLSCHSLDGIGGTVGPPLDPNSLHTRVVSRLISPDYRESVLRVNELTSEPFASWQEERDEILEIESLDEKYRRWVKYRLMEPKFDDPDAQMPNLGLSEPEAEAIAVFLAGRTDSLVERGLRAVFGTRRGLITFGAGALAGALFGLIGAVLARRFRDSVT